MLALNKEPFICISKGVTHYTFFQKGSDCGAKIKQKPKTYNYYNKEFNMGNYAILRHEKITTKAKLASVIGHNRRLFDVPNADKNKKHIHRI